MTQDHQSLAETAAVAYVGRRGRTDADSARLVEGLVPDRRARVEQIVSSDQAVLAARTRVVNEKISALQAEFPGATLLDLGCGFETRFDTGPFPAYVGLDLAAVVGDVATSDEDWRKSDGLATPVKLVADLSDPEQLRRCLDPISDRDVVILLEGVVHYLAPEQLDSLHQGLGCLPNRRALVSDVICFRSADRLSSDARSRGLSVRLWSHSTDEVGGGAELVDYVPMSVAAPGVGASYFSDLAAEGGRMDGVVCYKYS